MTWMRGKPIQRLSLLAMASLLLLSFLSAPVCAAGEPAEFSDAMWRNGSYHSSLGDMAGRQLYVCGIVDSRTEVGENGSDRDIFLDPDGAAGRLDAALYLYRIFGSRPERECPFYDVPEVYAEAVAWLYEAGITKGIGNGQYGIGSITGHQLLVMLSRFLGWGSEERSAVFRAADSLSLLPMGPGSEVFTNGDLYQTLCAVTERFAPEKAVPVRAEMSIPESISLTAASLQDAERQIRKALRYLPGRIAVQFTQDCPQEDVELFQARYGELHADGTAPILCAVDRSYLWPYSLTSYSEGCFKLWISGYCEACLAAADALNWLRVYEDTSYSAALEHFEQQYLSPLKAETSTYERIAGAYALLRDLASYDYAAYYRGGHPAAHTLRGFLENGKVECDGYAKTLQWMLTDLGIDSFVVIGEAGGKPHAWNKVLLDGTWYNADACWDDSEASGSYFLKSDFYFELHQHGFADDFSALACCSSINYESRRNR